MLTLVLLFVSKCDWLLTARSIRLNILLNSFCMAPIVNCEVSWDNFNASNIDFLIKHLFSFMCVTQPSQLCNTLGKVLSQNLQIQRAGDS